MPSIVDQISNALNRALAPPDPRSSSTASAGDIEMDISPWALWLLFGLVRHEARQQWVAQIAVDRLGADLIAISNEGALAHPEGKESGLVPGLTDWEYSFHGTGCCVTNRITGEMIDVDFYDGSAEWFDGYFYLGYLESLKQPPFVEQRIITLHPTLETALIARDELLELGLLEWHPESKVVRLMPDCRDWADQIEALGKMTGRPEQVAAVGMALGDWLLVQNHSQPNDLINSRAQKCIAARVQRLTTMLSTSAAPADFLRAIADLDISQSRSILESVFHGEPSGTTLSAALEIVHSRPDEDWTDEVFQSFSRINPNGVIPEPHILLTCAEYLLSRQRHVPEVGRKLAAMTHRELGDAAILALEHLPDLARELFRRALRSWVPNDRMTAAAALAILDRPWSREELQNVLRESNDQQATAECRAALRALPHPELHRFVEDWESRHPHEPETGEFITMEESLLSTRDGFLQYQMQMLHDRVLPLRGRVV